MFGAVGAHVQRDPVVDALGAQRGPTPELGRCLVVLCTLLLWPVLRAVRVC